MPVQVCAAPLYVAAAHVTDSVGVAAVMLHEPLTEVTAKFVVDPLTVGITDPEPTLGPTVAGVFAQLRPTVYVPVTAQAGVVACVAPL